MRIKQTHRKDGGQGWVGLCNDRGICGVAEPRPLSSYLGSLSKINSQPEDKQSDKPPVEGVKPLLGSCRVLHHDPEQRGQLAVQLVSVVGHLQRLWLCQGWRWRHRPCPPKGHSEAGSGWPSWIQSWIPKTFQNNAIFISHFPYAKVIKSTLWSPDEACGHAAACLCKFQPTMSKQSAPSYFSIHFLHILLWIVLNVQHLTYQPSNVIPIQWSFAPETIVRVLEDRNWAFGSFCFQGSWPERRTWEVRPQVVQKHELHVEPPCTKTWTFVKSNLYCAPDKY